MTKLIDISMAIEEGMLTYPRNPRPHIKGFFRMPHDTVNQSVLSIGSHTGTHADSGFHAFAKGWKMGDTQLSAFFGSALLVDVTRAGRLIQSRHLVGRGIREGDIVLLKTYNSEKGGSRFRKDYASLAIDGARYLRQRRVKAVGIDYLSIERFGSDFSVHRLLLGAHIPIIEGLVLKNVARGRYTFIGFPLKYDADAAPMRAVLMK